MLLQVAHPKIAQGVADHSRYREDPLGRGIRTFTAVYSIVFGTRDEAIAAAQRVRSCGWYHGRCAVYRRRAGASNQIPGALTGLRRPLWYGFACAWRISRRIKTAAAIQTVN